MDEACLINKGAYDLAVEAYQQAIDSDHAEWAPKAAYNLGMLFGERGEYDLAKEAYPTSDRLWALGRRH